MNKKTTTSLLLMLAAATLAAEASQISPRQAEAIASQFVNSTPRLRAKDISHSAAAMKVAYTKVSATSAGENLLHVVNRGDDGGYVVVAGDDAAPNVVLGYSTGGTFDYETAPENLRWWLDEYGRQMEYMIENGITASEQASAPTFDRNVEPMVTTRWNQDAPYNNMCPTLNGLRTYTGCVATAMAQVMNYHEWPVQGTGSHSYYDDPNYPNYGCGQTLSANFGETTYRWDLMLDTYDANSSQESQDAVATLMYHCGVSVDMTYMQQASGALSGHAAQALVEYFGYPADVQILSRDYRSYDEWVTIIKGEIDAGRPVLFGAQSTAGGHEFVIDGYNIDGYFHVNWGWGGQSDDYFLIATLNPYDGQGIGGGSDSGFKFMQDIIINVRPNPTGNEREFYEICADGSLSTNVSSSSLGRTARVSLPALYNFSRQYITAYAGIGIEDSEGRLIETSYNTDNVLMTSYGYLASYGTNVSFTIPEDLEAGEYRIYPYYRKYNDETTYGRIHVNYTQSQYISMTIDSNGTATFGTAAPQWKDLDATNITVTDNPTFTTGQTTRLTVDITNNGEETFSAPLSFALLSETSDNIVYSPLTEYDMYYGYPSLFDVYTIPAGETENVEMSLTISNFTPSAKYYRVAIVDENENIIGIPQLVRITNPTISLNGMNPEILPSAENVDPDNIQARATLYNQSDDEEYIGNVSARILAGGRYTVLETKEVTIPAAGSLTVEFSGSFADGEAGKEYSLWIFDASGKSLFPYANFTLAAGTGGVEDASIADGGTRLYPNPVGDLLNVTDSRGISRVQVFGLTGSQVLDVATGGDTAAAIDMSALPAGTYIVRTVITDGTAAMQKVIKK